MRRFLTLLLSLTLLVVISACGQSAQNGETAEKTPAINSQENSSDKEQPDSKTQEADT